MSAYNRYRFLKKLNKRSIVLIRSRNKYISYDRDMKIIRYIKFNMKYDYCSLNYLDNYEINYIVLDNLDIIIDKHYDNNNYMKYLKLYYLDNIIKELGNNLIDKLL